MLSINASIAQVQTRARLDPRETQRQSGLKETQNEAESSAAKNDTVSRELELSQQELKQLRELQAIDRRVRAHELAHLSAAGSVATSAASFQTKTGPDGRVYAVGGEVAIDTSPVSGDPQATIQKARQIRRAAQAPVDPSSQDRSVAAAASAMEQKAQVELRTLQLQEMKSERDNTVSFRKVGEQLESEDSGNLINETV